MYLPCLPTKSFFFSCKKRRLTKGTSDIQTLPNPVSSDAIFFLYASIYTYFVLLLVSPLLLIYYTYMHLTGSSCHSLPLPPLCAFSALLYLSFPTLAVSSSPFHMFSHSLITCLRTVIFFSTSRCSRVIFVCPFHA